MIITAQIIVITHILIDMILALIRLLLGWFKRLLYLNTIIIILYIEYVQKLV